MLAIFNSNGAFIKGKSYFTGNYGESIHSIVPTSDSSLLLLMGRRNSNSDKIGVVKIDPEGTVIWSKTAMNTISNANKIISVAGGYLFGGSQYYSGKPAAFLAVKIDIDGNVIWEKAYSSSHISGLWSWSITTGLDGSIFLLGRIEYSGGIKKDIVVKLNSNGTLLWAKTYQNESESSVFRDFVTLNDGTLLVGGMVSSPLSIYRDVWILHLDADGNVLTSHILNRGSDGHYLDFSGMAPTSDNQAIITLNPSIIAKISADAVTEWAYKYDKENEDAFFPGSLYQIRDMPSDGFLVTGAYDPDYGGQKSRMAFVKTDEQGLVNGCCLLPVSNVNATFPVTPVDIILVPNAVSPFNDYILNVEEMIPNVSSTCEAANLGMSFSLSDSVICPMECVTASLINPTSGFEFSLVASPGSEISVTQPNAICFSKVGEYQVQGRVANAGCVDTLIAKSLIVRSIKDQTPNAFTPNGDNANDVFKPIFFCPVEIADLRIYNRWGQLVFQTNDPDQGWNGIYNGQPAPSDVYIWRIEYEAFRENGRQRFSEKGEVSLMR